MPYYLVPCRECGRTTSAKYARKHAGLCKTCSTGELPQPRHPGDRQERILEHGWDVYQREEGAYDTDYA